MKPFWHSKTFWLNLATMLVALLTAFAGHPWITEHPQLAAVLTAVVALLNVMLRFITAVPVPVSFINGVQRQ